MTTRRHFLVTAATAALMAHQAKAAAEDQLNPWIDMNGADYKELPSGDPDANELWLYTDRISYAPGDEVIVYIHSTRPDVTLVIEREGGTIEEVSRTTGIEASMQETPEDPYAVGYGWSETHRFTIPSDWRSGVYVMTATATGPNGREMMGEHMFVLRAAQPGSTSKIALIPSTGTYVAYNDWGGANYYRTGVTGKPQRQASTQRPWARGFVRLPLSAPRNGSARIPKPFENPRYPNFEWALTNRYSRHYSDAGFAYYDSHFAKFMEREGFTPEYLTQHDLHADPDVLKNYDLAVFGGHDEYWSSEMRDACDGFLEEGGNIARFGGNLLWQVRMNDEGTVQFSFKHVEEDPLYEVQNELVTTVFDHPVVNRSIAASFGLTGTAGIYVGHGGALPRGSRGYTVFRPAHWALEGTDLYYGDVFGDRPTGIVAFEVDGLDYTFRNGLPEPTYLDGAPEDTEIIAWTPAIKGEQDMTDGKRMVNAPLSEFAGLADPVESYYHFLDDDEFAYGPGEGPRSAYGCSAIVTYTVGKGTVFNAGTACWVHGFQDKDFFVEQITKNVLSRLST